MNPKNLVVFAGSTLLSLFLVGCGGGGSSSSTPAPVTSSGEGVYEGSISNGRIHNTLVLENDQFFTLYGNAIAGGGLAVTGFIQGNGKSNNGNFTSTDLKDFFANGTVVSGSLSASYTAKTSLNGSVTEGSSTVTFTGTSPLKNSLYVYEKAANLANIVGAWSLFDLQGSSTALNIVSNGAFTGTSNGCSFSGTLNPRASGKNVFDLALTFGAAPCRLAGQAANGIAVEYPLSNGTRQLLIAGTNATRTNGTALLGVR